MKELKRYLMIEASEILKVEQRFIIHCIRSHWIHPLSPSSMELDDEDLARLQLIRDLQDDFGVNEESIPLILHLLDQLYSIHNRVHEAQIEAEAKTEAKSKTKKDQ